MTPGGYCGKIARVDLTRGSVKDQALDERWVKDFLGGTGVAAKILFDEVPPGISAFDPTNKLESGSPQTALILPDRFTEEPLKQGASRGLTARSAEMLDEYYRLRGWDPVTRRPLQKKLQSLSLGEESKALYRD